MQFTALEEEERSQTNIWFKRIIFTNESEQNKQENETKNEMEAMRFSQLKPIRHDTIRPITFTVKPVDEETKEKFKMKEEYEEKTLLSMKKNIIICSFIILFISFLIQLIIQLH